MSSVEQSQPHQQQQHRLITSYRPPPPHDKDVTVTLLYLWETDRYEVTSTINTIWYRPGDWLTEEIVGSICALPRWTVTVGPYELLKKIEAIWPKISIL